MKELEGTTDPLWYKDAIIYELDALDTGGNEAVALDPLTHGWSGLLAGHFLSLLETVMLAWLPRQRWFGAKTREIQSMRVLDRAELPAVIAANRSILSSTGHPAGDTIDRKSVA